MLDDGCSRLIPLLQICRVSSSFARCTEDLVSPCTFHACHPAQTTAPKDLPHFTRKEQQTTVLSEHQPRFLPNVHQSYYNSEVEAATLRRLPTNSRRAFGLPPCSLPESSSPCLRNTHRSIIFFSVAVTDLQYLALQTQFYLS